MERFQNDISKRFPHEPITVSFEPWSEDASDPNPDCYQRLQAQERRNLLVRVAAVAIGLAALAVPAYRAGSELVGNMTEAKVQKVDSNWGVPIEPRREIVLETAGFGGINEVKVRALVTDEASDVLGMTKPGCRVLAFRVLGPPYRVDGSDESNLPKTKIGTEDYRPWFLVQAPAFEMNEDGTFRQRMDKQGNAVMLSGYIRGTNLQAPSASSGDCAGT